MWLCKKCDWADYAPGEYECYCPDCDDTHFECPDCRSDLIYEVVGLAIGTDGVLRPENTIGST